MRLSKVCFWLVFISTILCSTVVHSFSMSVAQLSHPSSHINNSQISAIETLHLTIAEDPADLYLPPETNSRTDALPIALMLPGALVNRSHYSQFASAVARRGFAVVVPSHERSIPEFGVSGELAEVSQVTTTLAFLEQENANSSSALYQRLDLARMALLGHSHGGFVGLQAIANVCFYPFCVAPFTRPDAVVAGVFYGVNSQNPATGEFIPTANQNIPVALIQGSLDSIATPEEAIATYDQIQTPPKALITIEGSNHYGITNLNNPPGAKPDSSNPTLDQSQGIETIAQWTAYFLRAHLYQDLEARAQIYQNDRLNSSVTIMSILQ